MRTAALRQGGLIELSRRTVVRVTARRRSACRRWCYGATDGTSSLGRKAVGRITQMRRTNPPLVLQCFVGAQERAQARPRSPRSGRVRGAAQAVSAAPWASRPQPRLGALARSLAVASDCAALLLAKARSRGASAIAGKVEDCAGSCSLGPDAYRGRIVTLAVLEGAQIRADSSVLRERRQGELDNQ
jgi:hypothetical protein